MVAIERSTLHAVAGQALGKVVAIFGWATLVSVVAQRLSPSHFGQFMLAANLAILGVLIGSFGQPQMILFANGRLGLGYRTKLHSSNFARAVRITAGSACVASLGSAFALAMVVDEAVVTVAVCAFVAWVFSATWQALLAEEAKSVSRFWIAGLFGTSGGAGGAISTLVALGCLVVAVPVLHQSTNLTTVLIALAVGAIVATSSMIAVYVADGTAETISVTTPAHTALTSNEMYRLGFLATSNAGLTFLVGQSDLWWSAIAFGVEVSGQYATAAYLARFCSLSTILLSSAFAGRFASMLVTSDGTSISFFIRRCSLLSVGVSLITLLGLVLANHGGIISELFRLNDPQAGIAMTILSIGHLIGGFFGFGPVLLIAAGRFSELLAITAISAIFTTLLASMASLTLGPPGLAAAYAAGYIAYTYSCHRRCVTKLNVRPFHRLESTSR